MPLDDFKPYSKDAQLARGPKRPRRQTASRDRWAQIAAAKQGPCRVCGRPGPNELHHLIARSQSGADTESNCVPLCPADHARIEARDGLSGHALAASLTDAEYAYCVEHYGEAFFERRLGISYTRV